MTWSQNYTPLADSIGLSALVAALPVVTLLALPAFWHVRAHLAALAGLPVVALTESDTSSNVLFGNLQKVTAQQLDLSPILTAASNSSGDVMGKMIDAQSIVVAAVATGGQKDSPDAGTILRAVFWHSIALATLMGILVMLQAYVFKWMIVVPPTVTP